MRLIRKDELTVVSHKMRYARSPNSMRIEPYRWGWRGLSLTLGPLREAVKNMLSTLSSISDSFSPVQLLRSEWSVLWLTVWVSWNGILKIYFLEVKIVLLQVFVPLWSVAGLHRSFVSPCVERLSLLIPFPSMLLHSIQTMELEENLRWWIMEMLVDWMMLIWWRTRGWEMHFYLYHNNDSSQ